MTDCIYGRRGRQYSDINLPVCQDEFILPAAGTCKPPIGVHFDGRPISSGYCWNNIPDAIPEAWESGQKRRSCSILTGAYNPW